MRVRLVAAAWLLACAAPGAVQVDLDLGAVDEALRAARSGTAAARARAHEAYRIIAAQPPVDYIDVVTPFRRIVLAAQERAAVGDRSFGQRQALELLRDGGDRLDIYIEMTFDPRNTYIGVPEYDVVLVGEGGRVTPRAIDRLSRWTPRVAGAPPAVTHPGPAGPPGGGPLVGATVIARFDLDRLDPDGAYELTVREGSELRARVRIDLGLMR